MTQPRPEISIIVPIYKVERYLRECLDSILAQSFTDWECILVDDGSPASSPAICEEYAAADSRFRVIHRPNGGLSAARNTGLREAKGRFIGFIDSDDWAAPDLFSRLHHLITSHGTDMAQVGFINEYVGTSRRKPLVAHTIVLDQKGIIRELAHDKMLPNYMWNKLFRRECIGPDFPEGKVFEDIRTFNIWLSSIKSAVLAPEPLYHYRRRKGSIVNSNFSSSRREYLQSCIERERAINEVAPGLFSPSERSAYLWQAAINAAKTVARYEAEPSRRMQVVREISELCQGFPPPPVGELGLKKWWRANLLRMHPQAFISIMRAVFTTDFHTKNRNAHLYD